MKFSNRTHVDLSETSLARICNQVRAYAGSIDLTESNPTRCDLRFPAKCHPEAEDRRISSGNQCQTNTEIPRFARDDIWWSQDALSYDPDPIGMVSARRAVCAYYANRNVVIDEHQVVLSASTSEAYSWIFKLLCNRGDAVLVPSPSYPLFSHLAQLEEVALQTYPLLGEEHWHVDCDALQDTIEPNTRAICLIHPNNPTGTGVDAVTFKRIEEIALHHHLALIVDEVFLDYGMEEHAFSTLAGSSQCLTLVMSGLSKVAALPQMKLAWTIVSGPARLREEALQRLALIADTYLSVATPIQLALPSILQAVPQIQEDIRQRVKSNRDQIEAQLAATGLLLRLSYPEGGWFSIVELPRIHNEETWTHMFAELDGVVVYPGYFFDMPREARIVVSLLPEENLFNVAVEKIVRRVVAECRQLES